MVTVRFYDPDLIGSDLSINANFFGFVSDGRLGVLLSKLWRIVYIKSHAGMQEQVSCEL
jgi:hypothetical protein